MTNQAPASIFDTKPSGRPGRPRGSRAKLAQRFLESTYSAWEEQGDSALRRAAFHDPMGFVSMVARLMPQKIEVSHPTDGMSDERLAELLDMAERMAALRDSALAHKLTNENGLIDVTPSKGGGGPERSGVAGGEGCPSTTRSASPDQSDEEHNKLSDVDAPTIQSDAEAILPYPVGRPFAPLDHEVEAANRAMQREAEIDVDPASLF